MERASCLRRKRDYVAHKVILRTTFLPGVGPSGCNFLCVSVFIPKKHSSSILRGKKTLMQIKLQPEGPIPGRKLVRKMTVCACTRRNPACDGAPPLRKKFRALSPPTRCWLCRGAVAISRAGSYKKQILGIKPLYTAVLV